MNWGRLVRIMTNMSAVSSLLNKNACTFGNVFNYQVTLNFDRLENQYGSSTDDEHRFYS